LGKATRNKIEDNLTVLPRGEDERPIDLPPEKPKALPSLPQKRQPVGDPRVKPLPDNRVPKVRRASPQDRVNSDVLEDERQYQELAKEVQRYHTIPGTSSKITKQVKQRVEQNASIIKRQEENYRRVNDNVNQATARIDSLEADVAKLEEAYRTGQNIEEAKKTYLEAIARVEGNLDNASGVLSRVDELDNAIARTSRVRASAEQSIVNNPNRQRRQEALDAKLKAARANTTDLEEDLANINRNSILIVLKNEIDQLDRLSAILREDPSNIRGNIQNSKARLEELKNRVNQASQERASLKRQYKERFSILQQEINDVESQISEVRTRLNFADDKIQRYRVETARLRRDTKADPKDVARAERELKKWESTKNTASRELRSLDKRLTALKKQRKDNKDNRGFSRGGKLAMFVSNMRKRL
jgi:chromosome segregation ATPase